MTSPAPGGSATGPAGVLDGEVAAALLAVEPRQRLLTASALIGAGALDAAAETLGAVAERVDDADPVVRGELCEQLLRLAGELTGRGRPAAAEDALRLGARVLPGRAIAALAHHLQGRGEVTEALALWAEAVRIGPGEVRHHLQRGRILEAQLRLPEAYACYLGALEVLPGAGQALRLAPALERVAGRLPEPAAGRSVSIAVLGSATLDQLRACLVVQCHRAGLRPRLHLAGFDQYAQEILDPGSGLYGCAPDMVVLAVHRSRFFPRLCDSPHQLSLEARRTEIERGVATVRGLVAAFRERSGALLLLHNMVVPQNPALGIADARDQLGEGAMVVEINRRLAELVRTEFRDVHLLDEDGVQARCGKASATDPRLWLVAGMPWSDAMAMALAAEHVRHLRAHRGLSRKCLVLDLDDTLWGGVAGEDGAARVELGGSARGSAHLQFQRELRRLRARGVLLAICSKNNPEDAVAVFETRREMLLRLDDFAAARINWRPKPENVVAIAAELDIGLDSMVFWDDSPAERAQMRAALPAVLTPEVPGDPALLRQALVELTVFDSLALTEEDRDRTRLYREQADRRRREDDIRGSGRLEDHLAELRTVVEIAPSGGGSLARVSQLTRKTSQFNLTGLRLSEAEIEVLQRAGRRVYAMRVADRFGDSGLVGVGIAGPGPAGAGTWEIDVLLLSCRVIGRGVESALLHRMARDAREAGAARLAGRYLPTDRNRPARDCYRDHGFREAAEASGDAGARWELDLETSPVPVPAWLEVRNLVDPEVV
ncbi:MAG: hypothetical protein QOG45_707 [Chloroflexota bacterium]|nr:hypothetical protein [Chloroflexota bacterium]